MAGNASLNKANIAKQDEFYTQLTDIEKELRHYRKHFKGKTVLCNCDDPFESNFFKYFALNFNRLGLKKLIATCYAGSPIANRQLSSGKKYTSGPLHSAAVISSHSRIMISPSSSVSPPRSNRACFWMTSMISTTGTTALPHRPCGRFR